MLSQNLQDQELESQKLQSQKLRGRRILIAEDEYLLAEDLRKILTAAGTEVLGPCASVADAAAQVARGQAIDAAALDINLRGEMIYPVADALRVRGVPFAFVTGYDQWTVPDRFADVPQIAKPCSGAAIVDALEALIDGDGPGPLADPTAAWKIAPPA